MNKRRINRLYRWWRENEEEEAENFNLLYRSNCLQSKIPVIFPKIGKKLKVGTFKNGTELDLKIRDFFELTNKEYGRIFVPVQDLTVPWRQYCLIREHHHHAILKEDCTLGTALDNFEDVLKIQ